MSFIIVCGSRSLPLRYLPEIKQLLSLHPPGSAYVHGGAAGADSMAAMTLRQLGRETIVLTPLWGTYGRAAGCVRNKLMLSLYPPLYCIALHYGVTRGTQHMVKLCMDRHILVYHYCFSKSSEKEVI